jgi:hypothetical protein
MKARGVEIHGRQNGLQRVDLEGSLVAAATHFLAAAEFEVAADFQFFGSEDQMLFADKVGPQFRKLAFGKIREALVQLLAGYEAENRVAEELQLLVVTNGDFFSFGQVLRLRLAGEGAMGQGKFQQSAIAELVAESGFEFSQIRGLHVGYLGCTGTCDGGAEELLAGFAGGLLTTFSK